MSRIDELIAEYCPNGVPYRLLGEVTQNFDSLRRPVTKSHRSSGSFPYYGANGVQDYVAEYIFDGTFLLVGEDGSVKQPNGTPILHWASGRIWVNNHAHVLQSNTKDVELRFLYYYLQTQDISSFVTGGTQLKLNQGNLNRIRVAVPPLEVQQEIVRVLDQFILLEEELEAELDARRLQYAFYRAKILNPGRDWRTTTLGEIAEVFDGPHATPKKTSAGPWYLSISSLKDGNVDLTASAHLAVEDLPKWTRRVAPRCGDTLFSYETRIGQAAYWDRSEPAALGRRMGILRPRDSAVVPKFLTVAYLSPEFQATIASKTVRGSTVDRIAIADLPNWPIAVPSVDEQQRIIALLDKFDALVNDLDIGLPAELAARRKQYEYYLDRLLTFEEAVA